MQIERYFRLIPLYFGLVVLGWTMGCTLNRVHPVDTSLYKSLPADMRSAGFEKEESQLRVIEGKIAKGKTDIHETNQAIYLAEKEVEQKRAELVYRKQRYRELKRQKVERHELEGAKADIKMARYQWKMAKLQRDLQEQTREGHRQEIAVLEAQRNVALSRIELAKIRQVHEFTQWKVPDADLQMADFKEQVRRFEVQESREKHRLAQEELRRAREKQRIRQFEEQSPSVAQSQKSDKPFWQDLFSFGRTSPQG